jgi:hypothetical protein
MILKKKAVIVALILFMVAWVFFALAYPTDIYPDPAWQQKVRADGYDAIGEVCLVISLGIAVAKIVQLWIKKT